MKRRNFLKFLASVPLVAAAFIDYKGEAQQPEPLVPPAPPETPFDLQELYCSPEVKEALHGGDEQALTTIYSETDLNENRFYDPKWNVSGSWTKAQSRDSLISHLMGANHGFEKSHLDTLSTDQLQKLHDDDHNRTKITPRRGLFRFR